MQNKTKANATLATCAILAAGTLPSISPFTNFLSAHVIGLLNHGFIAATIGGLADWFAVTALFHKPLGISYRTELLKRNRGRYTEAITNFVENDLLNTKNIMDIIREEDAAKLLIDYLKNYQGREKIKDLSYDILSELFARIDSGVIAKAVTPIVENEIKNLDAEKIVTSVLQIVTDEKYSRRILIELLKTGKKIIQSEHMQRTILEKITALREAYEGDSAGRAMVLSSMNLTDEKILSIINDNVEEKIGSTLKILKTENSKESKNLTDTFAGFVKSAVASVDYKKFQMELRNIFSGKFNAADYIQNWLDINVKGEVDPAILEEISRKNAANPQNSRIVKIDRQDPIWRAAVENLIDEKIEEFAGDVIAQNKFDRVVKKLIENTLEEYHGQIPDMVRERLNRFNNKELTEFVESRVSDDLQMIRINGSVCGAAVGMLLYVVSQIIENFVAH